MRAERGLRVHVGRLGAEVSRPAAALGDTDGAIGDGDQSLGPAGPDGGAIRLPPFVDRSTQLRATECLVHQRDALNPGGRSLRLDEDQTIESDRCAHAQLEHAHHAEHQCHQPNPPFGLDHWRLSFREPRESKPRTNGKSAAESLGYEDLHRWDAQFLHSSLHGRLNRGWMPVPKSWATAWRPPLSEQWGKIPLVSALGDIVGDSPGIRRLREQLEQILTRTATASRLPPILLRGETGT